jgi:hypothetical protein
MIVPFLISGKTDEIYIFQILFDFKKKDDRVGSIFFYLKRNRIIVRS